MQIMFVVKNFNFNVPNPTTLWRTHLKDLYNSAIDSIRAELKDEYIWISIDETSDALGRYVANVIVGSLNKIEDKNKRFLLNMEFLDKTNNCSLVQSVTNAFMILQPEGIRYEKVLLLLTDAAPYMKLAGNTLCGIYQKLIHLTCLAHGVHNVCEEIMKIYGNVNSLVSNGKTIIVKSRNRRQLFEQMFPEIPLPPEPVRTRQGLWLKSVEYYTKYFTSFCDFVKKLDANESKAIEDTQNLIIEFESSLICDLTYIKANFNCLIEMITKLETNGMLLFNSLNLIDSTLSQMRESH